ncbi:hypothetical protein ACJ72_07253 [Emergomyces africanus]|uniref:Uncharacterized protein n=1 Tax=Emergomyces africanus TaxID=1955775 RepID=A0A1B7NNT1_9EURO|nr:hypothetical protein ACJ72_07253 [Emergomyces africanus]
MPPIRRYLRISKYSVLECRIYLDNPADSRWLLDARDPALLRVFERIRPLVLPKLREENERARAKKKSKPVKDVLAEADDFEVSIFLREGGTSHSIVTKQKTFNNRPSKIQSNSSKLTGTDDSPIHVPDDPLMMIPTISAESDEEPQANLQDIPAASTPNAEDEDIPSSSTRPLRRGRRRRRRRSESRTETNSDIEADSNDEASHATKRKKTVTRVVVEPTPEPGEDDKKLSLATSYKGFTIWGRILCLLITRKGGRARPKANEAAPAGQALMEEWISTQAPQEFEED